MTSTTYRTPMASSQASRAWLRYFVSPRTASSRLRWAAVKRPSTPGAPVPSSSDAAVNRRKLGGGNGTAVEPGP